MIENLLCIKLEIKHNLDTEIMMKNLKKQHYYRLDIFVVLPDFLGILNFKYTYPFCKYKYIS